MKYEIDYLNEDSTIDLKKTIRPDDFDNYIGQTEIKKILKIYIDSALERKDCLDHVLLYGPPGLGKTTLAHIIANSMHSNIICLSAPTVSSVSEFITFLMRINKGDVLFIDEIHRLPKAIEEILYSVMEDFKIDILVSKNLDDKITLNIPKFTLVGATTNFGGITNPLRDRFGIIFELRYYTYEELSSIIERSASILDVKIDLESEKEIARRSRGTPRVANKLLRRIRDFAIVQNNNCIDYQITINTLEKLKVDPIGLNDIDIKYLDTIINRYNGGPVGINVLASTIATDEQTLISVCEPFLLQEGFIIRMPRGRMVTKKAYKHLGY